MRLDGKVALVTGASWGIGAAVARRYAAEGARVAVNHHPAADTSIGAKKVVEEITRRGGTAIVVAGDVSDEPSVEAMVAQVERELGPVDVLVANAARSGRGPWSELSLQEWEDVLSVNVLGAFLCCRRVYPPMRERGGGKIITVSSVMVDAGMPNALHYVTSKAALIGFTRALAREVGGTGITVNCVMPGAIRTEHELENFPDQAAVTARAVQRQAIPRRGEAGDLEGAFVFLASADSDFVTGQTICVDGGWVHR
ncbi:MAG TPA: 3-oxoacyl-ACP reductase family protein [Mycobacteriales bacterium]|nr:3-oxoacyl-ACP reductase family protein [Mycobacteriales bacterium]